MRFLQLIPCWACPRGEEGEERMAEILTWRNGEKSRKYIMKGKGVVSVYEENKGVGRVVFAARMFIWRQIYVCVYVCKVISRLFLKIYFCFRKD